MLRALITTALLTAAATHFFGTPPDTAAGYSLAACMALWFTWPLLRRATGLARGARRRVLRRTSPIAPAPAPALTQINHHHYYYGSLPAATARPDLTLPALPRRTRQQMGHDSIYDIIDEDAAR